MNAVLLPRALLTSLLVVAAAALAGCAGTSSGASISDGSPTVGRSGVEVFGTIDAGVSRTVNKSERR
ncbi:MAG: hypothetical protein EOO29_45225 [Comamonadaceae bacterium]|nr:MAG: hypothetical protein EOO29_45225 [Comamonadaceae bacterium]